MGSFCSYHHRMVSISSGATGNRSRTSRNSRLGIVFFAGLPKSDVTNFQTKEMSSYAISLTCALEEGDKEGAFSSDDLLSQFFFISWNALAISVCELATVRLELPSSLDSPVALFLRR